MGLAPGKIVMVVTDIYGTSPGYTGYIRDYVKHAILSYICLILIVRSLFNSCLCFHIYLSILSFLEVWCTIWMLCLLFMSTWRNFNELLVLFLCFLFFYSKLFVKVYISFNVAYYIRIILIIYWQYLTFTKLHKQFSCT